MERLEVAIPIRDKDPRLLENCLRSVDRAKTENLRIELVDLGSEKSDIYRAMANDFVLGYDYLDYHEWNKPLALNYVLKRAKSDWFGMLDGDYIIEKDFFVKIMDEFEEMSFIQCRGYEMGELDDVDKLIDHDNFCDIVEEHDMESRPETDFGGFQALPTHIGKEIGGYDERFRLYGGMHHEMRERLLNRGLDEERLHGDPKLIHQTHQNWTERNPSFEVAQERERHREVINNLSVGNRYFANTGSVWGEV